MESVVLVLCPLFCKTENIYLVLKCILMSLSLVSHGYMQLETYFLSCFLFAAKAKARRLQVDNRVCCGWNQRHRGILQLSLRSLAQSLGNLCLHWAYFSILWTKCILLHHVLPSLIIDLLNDDQQIREIREAQAGLPVAEGVEVLIGGTTFLSPSDMRDLLFGSHSVP